jgi:deoxyribonuclease-1
MNRLLFGVVAFLALPATLNAQSIYLSPQSLAFDTLAGNQRDSLAFFVVNHGTVPLSVTDINTNRSVFAVRDTAFSVSANDSVRVKVYFQTNQNVTWTDVVSVVNVGAAGTLPLRVRGTVRYTEPLYASTQGLWENSLKTALFNLVNNHTVLGYNAGRDRMFETIDDPTGHDTIECVYSGRRIYAPTRTEAQNQGFNTEHTWPQSFFGSADPMVSDINHLFPTDAEPNSRRANYPFGPVANITWQDGTSKLGTRSTGEIVFEPRDIHKGDVARALFYFLLRYPSNYGGYMGATQEGDLRVWYKSDPVSTKEILRNNAIATFQGKRNPLIDHPEFIDRITYLRTTALPPQNPDIVVSPSSIDFGTVAVGDSVEWNLLLMNNGLVTLTLSSITLQSPSSSFQVVSYNTSVGVDSFQLVRIRFKPQQSNQSYANVVVIQNNDPDEGTVSVAVSGSSGSGTVHQYAMSEGWNMTSLPLTVSDPRKTVVFPSATSSAFAFDQSAGYVMRDTLRNGIGYWLKFSPAQNVSIIGAVRVQDSVTVRAGWNLIGSISNLVVANSIEQIPDGIVGSSYFGYSAGYFATDTLQPGKGYWVKVNQDGQLVLN